MTNGSRKFLGCLTIVALAACGGGGAEAGGGADGAGGAAVPDAPAASIENPSSPPPVGTDVGAASGDTASKVLGRDTVGASRP